MPSDLTRVTVDLEGRVQDYHAGTIKNVEAIGRPVNVEVYIRELCDGSASRNGEFNIRVHTAVCERSTMPNATAYSVGKEQCSDARGYVWVPVQFYRWGK